MPWISGQAIWGSVSWDRWTISGFTDTSSLRQLIRSVYDRESHLKENVSDPAQTSFYTVKLKQEREADLNDQHLLVLFSRPGSHPLFWVTTRLWRLIAVCLRGPDTIHSAQQTAASVSLRFHVPACFAPSRALWHGTRYKLGVWPRGWCLGEGCVPDPHSHRIGCLVNCSFRQRWYFLLTVISAVGNQKWTWERVLFLNLAGWISCRDKSKPRLKTKTLLTTHRETNSAHPHKCHERIPFMQHNLS